MNSKDTFTQGFFFDYPEKEQQKKKKRESSKGRGGKKVKGKNFISCPCGLEKDCISPMMPYTGEGKRKILIIAEAPGKKEDENNTQLIGESGQLLRRTLKGLGIDLDKDCWKTNAVRCRPTDKKGNNRTPTTKEINCCRANLLSTVKELRPEKVIILGSVALTGLIGDRVSSTSKITKWTGWVIPDQELKSWLFITFHPAYILRNEKDIALKMFFEKHLKRAVEFDTLFPLINKGRRSVEILKHSYGVQLFLDGIPNGSIVSIDIETTGKKPYREGQQIISMSVCVSKSRVIVFPFFDDTPFLISMKKFLKNESIKKVAHNLKFESRWLEHFLKCEIKGWHWDTMVAAHVLDNRNGITGLKDQVYFNFGISEYDSDVSSYLKSSEKGGNELNNIKECDVDKLLLYNGLDSLYTYWLYLSQVERMTERDKKAYSFFHAALKELIVIEKNGILVSPSFYEKKASFLENRMMQLEKKIYASEEVGLWEKGRSGIFKDKVFDFNSPNKLVELLYNILKIPVEKETEKGNASVDYEALEKISSPFVKSILSYRKMGKIKDTYLASFMRECEGEVIHPDFNLHIASSFRSSCSSPNMQNVPVHEKQALRITRGGIIPTKGHYLLSIDYSRIEVCIAACVTKDPEMLRYMRDPLSDMHSDQAVELFLISKDEVTKNQRYLAKNNFVFPQFYGGYFVSCARNLWIKMDEDSRAILKSKGITTLLKYERVVKKAEDKMWDRFEMYADWKEKTWKRYQKEGIVELLTYFTCREYMKKNDVLNRPIQGVAFHLLLWSLIIINQYLRNGGYKTKVINQIHDDIVLDVAPDEEEELKPIIKNIMTEKIKEAFNWIIVPLNVEMKQSEIDGCWAEMKEVV